MPAAKPRPDSEESAGSPARTPPRKHSDADAKKSPRGPEPESGGVVVALYEFAGGADDELPLAVGDRVEIYAEVEGWYTGCNAAGRYGLFPAS